MFRDSENETVEIEGNVQIIYQDQHLSCQRARINLRAKTVDAIGDVLVVTPEATIGGERVILDYSNSTGMIFQGYVQSGTVFFEGSLIHKTSETDYLSEDAKYTTCTTCPEAWSFSGKNIRAELGGYAYIKNTLLRFAGIPVFWLPYLIVPLKSDRQTGLLTPELESSGSGGVAISQSVFWAMSRSQDATFTLKNYELRGLKGLTNYRYVLTDKSSGELDAGFLQDRVFANDKRLNNFRNADSKGDLVNRWFLRYNHYYDMPEGFVVRAQLNNASDLQYPQDFPLETLNHGDAAMENRVSVTKNTDGTHYSADASYYKNMLQSDPLAGNNDSVHRLPELRYSKVQSKIGTSDFLYSLDLNYVNFARSNFAYDDLVTSAKGRHIKAGPGAACADIDWEKNPACSPVRDGTYNPNDDLIRTGQRLDFRPTLYRPIRFENLDLLPQVSYRETQYTFPVGETKHNARRYVRAEISAKTTFSKIFGDKTELQGDRYKHEVQPELRFTTIPWIDHLSHPFFGSSASTETQFSNQENISDLDLNGPYGLQFDYNDRVYDRKLVTFALVNKLTRKTWVAGTPQYLQFLTWRLAQSHDLYQAENSANPEPWSDILSDLRLYLNRLEIYQRANYYPYQRVTNTSTRVRVYNRELDFFEVAHILAYSGITPGSKVNRDLRTEDISYSAKKGFKWFDFVGKLTYDQNPAEGKNYLKSWGYGAQVKLPGDCMFFNVTHYRITGGDTNFKLSFNFIWDGKDSPRLSEQMLDSFGF